MPKQRVPKEGDKIKFMRPVEGVETATYGYVQDLLSAQFTIIVEGQHVYFRFYTDDDWWVVE